MTIFFEVADSPLYNLFLLGALCFTSFVSLRSSPNACTTVLALSFPLRKCSGWAEGSWERHWASEILSEQVHFIHHLDGPINALVFRFPVFHDDAIFWHAHQ